MKPTGYLKDKRGRSYPVWVCARGHKHRDGAQFSKCQKVNRLHGLVGHGVLTQEDAR